MAILHQASLSPTKLELVTAQLDLLGWGAGPVTLIGGYRFDDPEGEVGVEGLIALRGGEAYHVPLTYRGAPVEAAEAGLLATMDHSVLGTRWVYDAAHDPVALACFQRALAGEQTQAVLELYDAHEHLVEVRTPLVTVSVDNAGPVALEDVTLARRLDPDAPEAGGPTLTAHWSGDNSAVVAFG